MAHGTPHASNKKKGREWHMVHRMPQTKRRAVNGTWYTACLKQKEGL